MLVQDLLYVILLIHIKRCIAILILGIKSRDTILLYSGLSANK